MLRAFKTEIDLTPEQIQVIHRTFGVCRFIYNFYIVHNKEVYENEKRFVSGFEFSKWLNNEFLPNNPEYQWIKEVGCKPVKKAIMNGEKAFKRFFKGESKFPNFKKKNKSDIKAYFPRNNLSDWTVERHRVKIPTLGFVRLKEKGYIKANANVTSGTVSMKAGRYYVSVLVEMGEPHKPAKPVNEGIGIDLGIRDFAIVSNMEKPFLNINKTKEVMDLEKRLKREQRKLSRKYESLKLRNKEEKGEATRQNIQKQFRKVQRLHQKLSNIRENHLNQVVNTVVKREPSYITIEDLNVSGMMKNRYLAKVVSQQGFYTFRMKLTQKCQVRGIELRIVNRFYPSSKKCSGCGFIKKNLKLSERTYECEVCGCMLDRDRNASINLANAKVYTTA
jgi:putative transposase